MQLRMSKQSWTQSLGGLLNLGRRCLSTFWVLEARLKGCQIGHNVCFVGRPLIGVAANSRLAVGDRAQIASALRANPLACSQPVVLRTLCPGAELILEQSVGISGSILCAASKIHIGEGTLIGSGAVIMDTDFHHLNQNGQWDDNPAYGADPIHIGRNVFVGARAIILKGVTIDDRAIVGAGAVVTKNVPANHVAVGNPARILARKPGSDSVI
jgi:carbonic anhydrase/acetyltransferase-like protein (isoleucine patch superfamily)